MTNPSPTGGARPDAVVPDPRHAEERPLRIRVLRPDRDTAVVAISGELVAQAVPRVEELLSSRLRGAGNQLVIDLSRVTVLSDAGVRALERAYLRARQLAVGLRIVAGAAGKVTGALTAAGLPVMLPAEPEIAGHRGEPETVRQS